jgi:hypothetical protein
MPTRPFARAGLLAALAATLLACTPARPAPPTSAADARIQAYTPNPHYLAWGEVPVFLLGATGYHAWTPISRPGSMDFRAQIDRLAGVIDNIGSPHVRGMMRALPYDPMNHMHDGPVERVVQPWVQLEDGRFDLERFEPAWEERLREYLDATLARGILVVLEVWDDWSVTRGPGGEYDPGTSGAWNAHPFNPNNNLNYAEDVLPATTSVCEAPFYSTIPGRAHIEPVLGLQKLYVDRLLGIVSAYPHVLINVNNESRAHLDWSRYWASYLRERMPAGSLIGDMPSTNRHDGGGECAHDFSPLTLATDPHYDFADVAQGVSAHEFGSPGEQALGGAARLAAYRRAMAERGTPRPLIISKDYTRGPDGGDLVLWSRFVGGAATARFHRPGQQHGPEVIEFQHQAIARLGRFIAEVPFWRMQPRPELIERIPQGVAANVLAEPEGQIVVQLLGGRAGKRLAVKAPPTTRTARWIDPARGTVLARFAVSPPAQQPLELEIPIDLEHLVLHLSP